MHRYLLGPASRVADAARWLEERLSRVCLVLKPSGYHAWSPTPLSDADRGLLINLNIPPANICSPESGFVVLGAPLGHRAYVAEMSCSIVRDALSILASPTFRSLRSQAQWLGLYFSASRRVSHLARFVPPDQLVGAERLAQDILADYACSFFRIPAPLPPALRLLLQLPLRQGGMGLRLFAREPAFLTGMLRARAVLRKRFELPEFHPHPEDSVAFRQAIEGAFSASSSLGAALRSARSALEALERIATTARDQRPPLPAGIRGKAEWETLLDPVPATSLNNLVPADLDGNFPEDLQSRLTSILHAAALVQWQQLSSVEDDAHRVSHSGPGAAAWLLAFPGGPGAGEQRRVLDWPDAHFLTALQTRLGVPLSPLLAAGLSVTGLPCWKSRVMMSDESDLLDTEAMLTGAVSQAATTPSEEGAREGLLPPSPHVHRTGGLAGSTAGAAAPTPSHRQSVPASIGRQHDRDHCGPHKRRH